MKLKKLFTTIYSIIIFLLITLSVIAVLMSKNNKKLIQSNINYHNSVAIAEELRQSSDDLTRYCRTYVTTGDSRWEKKYWEVLDIRNGEKPRPNGRTIALQDSMKKLGFTKPEFDKLKESEQNSNNLVWTERVAFHAINGLFADKDEQFTIHNTPDTLLARTIMFDEKYHYDKSIIMKPIDDFIEMVEQRSQKQVEYYTHINTQFLFLIIGLGFVISLISVISFFFIKVRIIKQLEELKKAKIDIEESEARLKAIHDASFSGIFIHEKGIIIDCNQGLSEMLGYSIDELIGMDGFLLVAENSKEIVKNNTITNYEKPYEVICLRKNGESFPVYIQGNTIPFQGKQVRTVEVIDVTEQKKAEQFLRDNESKLKELNTTKDKLFSIIAHDLRSPFNNILGFSSLLIDSVNDFDAANTEIFSRSINSSAKNTLNLLDNLLDWARSQTGEISFKPKILSLNNIISEIVKISNSKIKDISIVYNQSDDIEVYADPDMLKTVLRNLISNAIKFTNYKGRIDIITHQNSNVVEVTVSDNGTGMCDEVKNNLFQVGEQVLHKGTSGERGSGLGLVLCKEFIEKHGGEIWAESELGKGSDFIFAIPF